MPRRFVSHPGSVISDEFLGKSDLSGRDLADLLEVSASTLSRVLNGTGAISPEMALRLSKALGRTAESWLVLQNNYDLHHARQRVNLAAIKQLKAAKLRRLAGGPGRARSRLKNL